MDKKKAARKKAIEQKKKQQAQKNQKTKRKPVSTSGLPKTKRQDKLISQIDAFVNIQNKLPADFKQDYSMLGLPDFATTKLDDSEVKRLNIMFKRLNMTKRFLRPPENSIYEPVSWKKVSDPEKENNFSSRQKLFLILTGSQLRDLESQTNRIENEMWWETRPAKSREGFIPNLLGKITNVVERLNPDQEDDGGGGLFGGLFS